MALAIAVGAPTRADAAAVLGAALGLALSRALAPRDVSPAVAAAGVVAALAPVAGRDARSAALALLAAASAVALAAWSMAPPTEARPARAASRALSAGVAGAMAIALTVYAVFGVGRHARFGSGSWDYGCYVHNAYLFAHGIVFDVNARSSVLGDVAFWGGTNHFMPSLVLTAPIAWLMEVTGATSLLIVAQAFIVVAAAVPLAALARRRGLGASIVFALVVAWLSHIGVQSALLFDVHEIAPVPLLVFFVLWAAEDATPSPGKRAAVIAALACAAGTKESSWLYVAALGAFVAVARPGWRGIGVGAVLSGLVGFVLVTGVIQPALLEPEARGMLHAARFKGVGDSPANGLGEAAWSILRHPGRAVAAVLSPPQKVETLATIALGGGGFAALSPEALALSLPNVAERFLADKREMWGTAFHYSLVSAAYALAGGVLTLSRLQARRPLPARLVVGVVATCAVTSLVTARRAPDLARYEQPYFAAVVDVARYERALAHVHDDDAVVAQNHFLPHVALREHIWLPEARFIARADVVVLDTEASAWPASTAHIAALVASLQRDARFAAAFQEGTTWVFRRR